MAAARTQKNSTQAKSEEAYEKAEEAAIEAVDNIKEHVQQSVAAGSETLKSATTTAENTVKKRPLLSVGCAFLAGWAVAKLIK